MSTGQLLTRSEQLLRQYGRRAMRLHPTMESAMAYLWGLYVRSYLAAVAVRHRVFRPYGTVIDPYKVVRVDPAEIVYRTHTFERSKFKYAGTVSDGDWDSLHRRFEDTDVYQAYEAHFERGVPWEETAFFERVVGQIESGEVLWDCATRAEFEDRCARIDQLYENIREHGYKSQRELAASEAADPIEKRRFSLTERLARDEVAVSIGRDGDLLFSDGRNRLAIAKVLDLEEIPVWILIRHADWQQLRAALASGETRAEDLPAEVRDHPDLEEFVGC